MLHITVSAEQYDNCCMEGTTEELAWLITSPNQFSLITMGQY